jgi:hypothetical protein
MRTPTRLSGLAVAAIASFVVSMPTAAAARARWPVIGCDDNAGPGPINHYAWKWQPSGLCTITGATDGIDHARWKHWGSHQATATGDFVDGLGFMYPAKLTAYRLHVTHNLFGNRGVYGAWYTKLHVVAKREFRGSIERGPFNVVLDVTPWY